mmetsp:Transcript_47192/g.94001  ORF Transcript_47192/g.94001 Transcript_47192/m.94001 type:complete len:206 (-) Transcript_47192:114-731(-)
MRLFLASSCLMPTASSDSSSTVRRRLSATTASSVTSTGRPSSTRTSSREALRINNDVKPEARTAASPVRFRNPNSFSRSSPKASSSYPSAAEPETSTKGKRAAGCTPLPVSSASVARRACVRLTACTTSSSPSTSAVLPFTACWRAFFASFASSPSPSDRRRPLPKRASPKRSSKSAMPVLAMAFAALSSRSGSRWRKALNALAQ